MAFAILLHQQWRDRALPACHASYQSNGTDNDMSHVEQRHQAEARYFKFLAALAAGRGGVDRHRISYSKISPIPITQSLVNRRVIHRHLHIPMRSIALMPEGAAVAAFSNTFTMQSVPCLLQQKYFYPNVQSADKIKGSHIGSLVVLP